MQKRIANATLNYTYSFIAYEFDEQIDKSAKLVINSNDGSLTYSDAINIYNNVKAKLKTGLSEVEVQNKEFLLVDLYLNPESETPELVIDAIFGKNNVEKSVASIDPDDWWYWGGGNGKCGGYTGGSGLDAVDIIKPEAHNLLKNNISSLYYWDDISYKNFYSVYYPDNTNPDWDYKFFYWEAIGNWMWSPEPCLSPDDLTFFVNNYQDVIEEYETSINKKFISFYTFYDNANYGEGGLNKTVKKHDCRVKFGKIKRKPPADELPRPL